MAKSADAADLKSATQKWVYGFNSRLPHHLISRNQAHAETLETRLRAWPYAQKRLAVVVQLMATIVNDWPAMPGRISNPA